MNVRIDSLALSDTQGCVEGAQDAEAAAISVPDNAGISLGSEQTSPPLKKSLDIDVSLFVCDVCSARYKKYGLLVNHLAKKHGVDQPTLLKCDACKKCFDTVKKLNRHKKLSH